jgi:Ca2+:H+ antiporter
MGLIDLANAVEFVVSIIALIQGQVAVTQAALLGSMLSSLLLSVGLCFFFAGLNHKELAYGSAALPFLIRLTKS